MNNFAMLLRSPNNDKIFLQWDVANKSYIFRVYLLNKIVPLSVILLSGPAIIFCSLFFRQFLVSIGNLSSSILFFYLFFCYPLFLMYIFVSVLFIILSLLSNNYQKFYITDKGIYLLQKGMLGMARTFFKTPRYAASLPGFPGGIVGATIAKKVIDKGTEMITDKILSDDNLYYNYTSWRNIKKVITNVRSGVIIVREFRTNINTTVGFVVADKDIFSKVVQLIKERATKAIFKEN